MEKEKKEKVEIERYIHTEQDRYWRGEPHTDTIEAIDHVPRFHKKLYDYVMSGEEYEATILANSCISLTDIKMKEKDKIRIIVYSSKKN